MRNSVGKTTFINFIDYLLGKTSFIVSIDDKKKELFDKKLLLAEVIFGNSKFTVKRGILENGKIEVFDGWVIDNLISDKPTLKGEPLDLSGYRSFLTEKIYGENIIINNKVYTTHRNLMSYLIRDQSFGFFKYDSGIKEEKAETRKKRLEFLLGLISQKREGLETEIAELEKDKGNIGKEKNILKKYFELVTEMPLKELNKQKNNNDKQIKDLQNELDNRKDLLSKLNKLEEESKQIEVDLTRKTEIINEQIYILNIKHKDYQLAFNDIENELYKIGNISLAINIFNPFQFKRCPLYLKELKDEKEICEYIKENENKKDFSSMTDARKKILQFEKKDLNEAIKKVTVYIKDLQKEKVEILNNIEKNNVIQKKLKSEKEEQFDKVEEKISELQHKNVLLDKELANFKYVNKLQGDITDKNELISAKKEELSKLIGSRALDFNNIYDIIIKFITSNTRIGKIDIKDYSPAIFYPDGTLDKGSAMGNVAIIAFDLALLEMSLKIDEVSAVYPKFLIHDSPKIHDIQLEMYKRIMDYVIKMEVEYEKKNKHFQYIITTLDISEEIAKNKDTYVRLTLDNSGDGGKLFGCQVEIG